MRAKISVITPCIDSSASIVKAIESVQSQDYSDWEHIIVDGGSTDGTIRIIQRYSHLNWISEPDYGQSDAMNKGFLRSTGDVIVYLNADDYFLPGAFSKAIRSISAGADIVVGNILIKNARTGGTRLSVPKTDFKAMLQHWEEDAFCYNPVGYFYKRKVQEACPFNTNNNLTMDLEFLLCAASKFTVRKVEATLGVFVDSDLSKTYRSQLMPNHWRPETFPFIDKYVDQWSVTERTRFRAEQLKGYKNLAAYWQRNELTGLRKIAAEVFAIFSHMS